MTCNPFRFAMNERIKNDEGDKEATTMKMYIVKTKIATEDKVIADITARLEGAGSMKEKKVHIGKMINPAHLRGYLFVESTDEHYLEAVVGITGNALRIKNVISIVGEASDEDADTHLQSRTGTEGLEVGMIVEIKKGAWKGEQARIMNINADNTLTLELWGSHVPIPINNMIATEVRKV